ncbi:MAG: restriction endonuclease [Methylacidiphilales bacterium]|nr:restriction endonuclease [Candidatus Methylacidiphilales bacterium]NJR17341.1 restriction endonuclease [Calothrix sp. CSU_2_0]
MKLETFFNNFDLLADAPNGVQKLRELILQLAVMGKLVPQDKNDEPASVLLEKVKAEKEKLVKEKKLKKSTPLKPIEKDEEPHMVPKTWEWKKTEELCFVTKLAGFEYTKYLVLSEHGEVPVIRAQNVKLNNIDDTNLRFIDLKTSLLLERSALTKTAILMTFIGAGIGDVAIFRAKERWHLAPNVAKLEPFNNYGEKLDIKYLLIFLMSATGRFEIFKHRKSTAQPSLSMETIRDINIAIPPLAEQKRIVAKVDELMVMCDRISSRQQQKRETRILINNAAIGQLLTAREPEVFNKSWQHICNNFDLLYSTPDNIGKLRQAILQLAVQGKLVPQDENDEPASVLLEKIRVEKEQLVKEGKIKKRFH